MKKDSTRAQKLDDLRNQAEKALRDQRENLAGSGEIVDSESN